MATLAGLPVDLRSKDRSEEGTTAKHLSLLLLLWAVVFGAALFTPPLLDDADATHAQAAQAMLRTGDWVTLHVDGVRYLEKAPLSYWLAALSLRCFGNNAFAVHLPLALAVLGLAWLGYAWAGRGFDPRAGFYSALFLLTSAGTFLFTRIFIPDVLLSLLLGTALYSFNRALASPPAVSPGSVPASWEAASSATACRTAAGPADARSSTLPWAGLFWASMALAVLSKGLVALVLLLGTAALYLLLTRGFHEWRKLHPAAGLALLLAIAAPWHILAGLRNPGPAGGHGFFWFYFINEHVLRFLGCRIPRDYNKVPTPLFWLLHLVWLFPWSCFAPTGFLLLWRRRRNLLAVTTPAQRTTLLLAVFSMLVLVFFSFSTNQEYYTFPVYLPLLMLIAAAVSRAERAGRRDQALHRSLGFGYALFALAGLLLAGGLGYGLWTARHLPYTADIGTELARRGVGSYTLSMSHLFDLTGPSFAALRLPSLLALLAFTVGPACALWLHARRRQHAAMLAVALTSAGFLVAAHLALLRFAPLLSSSRFAATIRSLHEQHRVAPASQVLLFGDQSYGSSLPFYLEQTVPLVDGRSTSMLFGSTFPDAQPVFLTQADLLGNWGRGARKLLFVPSERRADADRLLRGRPTVPLLTVSGKLLLTDRPLDPAAITSQAASPLASPPALSVPASQPQSVGALPKP